MTFGEKVKLYRKIKDSETQSLENKKCTQKYLAEKTGILEPNIRKYENDVISPSYDTMKKISAALGVNIINFLDLDLDINSPDKDLMAVLFKIDEVFPLDFKYETDENGKIIKESVSLIFKDKSLISELSDLCVAKKMLKEKAISEKEYKDWQSQRVVLGKPFI